MSDLLPLAEDEAPLRVLVVDDETSIAQLISIRLKRLGYQVSTASHGAEAMASIAWKQPDLMFLDVAMPDMSGLEVLERVRSQELPIAVIMMTAFGSEQIAMEALRLGANEYLRKPFEVQEFKTVLARIVNRMRLERENEALRQRLDEKRRQLETELARAGEVQADLLPRSYPPMPGFDLAARCLPAREVGGDFYDWYQPEPGRLVMVLGDVMGKGMPAALLMATVRAVVRAVGRSSPPAEAMRYISDALNQDLLQFDRFVTLFLAQLDSRSGRFRFVDAGHGLAVVRRADGRAELLEPRGLPLGVLSDEVYQEGEIELLPGDLALLYSDGVLDATPGLLASRGDVMALVKEDASPQQAIDQIIARVVSNHALPDDLTIVALKRTGAS